MAEISAKLVKELRDQTGAGMMDCKRALQETNGDLEAARRLLREQGMATAAKRAGRATIEGKVIDRVAEDGSKGTLVAVGSETEPVSNNEEFLAFARKVLEAVDAEGPGAEAELETERAELAGRLGENGVVAGTARRVPRFSSSSDSRSPDEREHGVGARRRGSRRRCVPPDSAEALGRGPHGRSGLRHRPADGRVARARDPRRPRRRRRGRDRDRR